MRPDDIKALKISLIDSERFALKTYGEITQPKTIDTDGKPVIGGLFCPKIFGPSEPGKCLCGKLHPGYRRRTTKCEECGVVVSDYNAKNNRFGFIALESPVVHTWFKSKIATLLGFPPKKLGEVISCLAFIVIEPGNTDFKKNEIIPLKDYLSFKNDSRYSFTAGTGGAIIQRMLKYLDIRTLIEELKSKAPSRRVNQRLMVARDFLRSGIKPEWMVMKVIPVLPPGLRPVITMDDGTVASSDLNELYARVIHRNNRLKRLNYLQAPEVLKLIDMRLLQGAVDSLFRNRQGLAKNRSNKRALKSLSDTIEKKEGRLRRNLLGKRVDYSGRSVIVVGPTLRLNQCGLPIEMAMDMFRPFIYKRLLKKGLAHSLRHACKIVDRRRPEAIDALEEEIAERVVLLNRAPSLHRMSIQAFKPIIVAGRAIRLHPLVCTAFNADFDGDQIGVHIPVTVEAQAEARLLMLSINNILSPANGKLVMTPTQDIVLGIYFLTKEKSGVEGEGMVFADRDDALCAHHAGVIDLQAKIKVRLNGLLTETTPGRLILSEIFPPEIPFEFINKTIKKKDLSRMVEMCYGKSGDKATVALLDMLKDLGFKYATLSGISFCVDDITVPKEKNEIIERTEREVEDIKNQFGQGLITDKERHNKIVALWDMATEEISKKMMENIGVSGGKEFNSMYMMADSGARGSVGQISQIGGMRGLMAKPTGEVVETPIKANLKEGLSYHEYLLAVHGARKGRVDGALKTANAGYFTRRLVDVAHDIVVNEEDCGTVKGATISELTDGDEVVLPLEERIYGRYSAQNILDPHGGRVIVKRNEIINREAAIEIKAAGVTEVKVRSPFSCQSKKGVCIKCYGYALSTREDVQIGEAVGIIAAQSIGEPGTQLTLRTFHSGGTASGVAVKSSLEAKTKGIIVFNDLKTVQDISGRSVVVNRGGRALVLTATGKEVSIGNIPYGSELSVKEGTEVEASEKIAEWDPHSIPIIATSQGTADFYWIKEGVTIRKEADADTGVVRKVVAAVYGDMVPKLIIGEREYSLPIGAVIMVDKGDQVNPGDVIAKIPKHATKSQDITGGLPKVLKILELMGTEESAVIAEIDGIIKIHPKGRSMTVEILGNGDRVFYSIPVERQINFFAGDIVKAGDMLVDGDIDMRDILKVFGPEKAAIHIINDVQKVYLGQGVNINDKHLELITRKMLGFVEIIDPGDTDLVNGEVVTKAMFLEINKGNSGRKATARPVLLGLRAAALHSESWLSAASFERTTSVLTDAAIKGSVDHLTGVKENVLIAKKVPLGTGHPQKNRGSTGIKGNNKNRLIF